METACLLFGFGAILMDAAYPEERIAYAAGDVGAKIVIRPAMLPEMLAWPQKAAFGTVFMFNNAVELIQRCCPE